MSINLSSTLASSAVQPLLSNVIQSALNSTGVTGTGSAQQNDSSQLSPFAKLLSTLQNLQQSDPAKYKQVTAQIGQNLQAASQTAQAQGNTSAASQLSQLASDFSSASQSGSLPNIQDLAAALGGHHHRGHGSGQAANQLFSQLFQTGQSTASNSNPFDPGSIILNTLTSNGINPQSS